MAICHRGVIQAHGPPNGDKIAGADLAGDKNAAHPEIGHARDAANVRRQRSECGAERAYDLHVDEAEVGDRAGGKRKQRHCVAGERIGYGEMGNRVAEPLECPEKNRKTGEEEYVPSFSAS